MSIRDTSLDPKILLSAKKEFLEKGFLDASLQNICKDAGVTTGAIYRRYKGKEDLFAAVVEPAIKLFDDLMKEGVEVNKKRAAENRLKDSFTKPSDMIKFWIEEIYKDYEIVKILLAKADGTIYSNFIHDFIEKNFSISYDFMKDLEKQGRCKLKLRYEEYHILLTSYWTALFEMVVHDFSLDEMFEFSSKISDFFSWEKLIEFT